MVIATENNRLASFFIVLTKINKKRIGLIRSVVLQNILISGLWLSITWLFKQVFIQVDAFAFP